MLHLSINDDNPTCGREGFPGHTDEVDPRRRGIDRKPNPLAASRRGIIYHSPTATEDIEENSFDPLPLLDYERESRPSRGRIRGGISEIVAVREAHANGASAESGGRTVRVHLPKTEAVVTGLKAIEASRVRRWLVSRASTLPTPRDMPRAFLVRLNVEGSVVGFRGERPLKDRSTRAIDTSGESGEFNRDRRWGADTVEDIQSVYLIEAVSTTNAQAVVARVPNTRSHVIGRIQGGVPEEKAEGIAYGVTRRFSKQIRASGREDGTSRIEATIPYAPPVISHDGNGIPSSGPGEGKILRRERDNNSCVRARVPRRNARGRVHLGTSPNGHNKVDK